MRRVRLLIYDGPEEWIAATKTHEFALLGRTELGKGKRIVSVEVDEVLVESEPAVKYLVDKAEEYARQGSKQPIPDLCPSCEGSGRIASPAPWRDEADTIQCPDCDGEGTREKQ